ncbi:MAG: recombinase RecX [Deltaproteobacteria bacterium]|nr:MAG: recombinase RecX [Deltaproteobacteria bacterium]
MRRISPQEQIPPPTFREGTITKLQQQRKDPKRVSIFIDEEFAFGMNMELAMQHALEKGRFLTVEKQREVWQAERLLRAKTSALDYIAYKARTEHEVFTKLRSNGFEEEIVESVIARFRDLGYINDEQYAQQYAKSRLNNKGHGPRRIQNDLRRRGVSSSHISDAIDNLSDNESQIEIAYTLAEKRWARLAKESNPLKRRKKLQDFLVRRGFDFDTIRAVVDRVRKESND